MKKTFDLKLKFTAVKNISEMHSAKMVQDDLSNFLTLYR